ncbi:hypothetical protein DUZ99_10625 [Xylanibacillus composti]|nr:hypothetical protein [Xylanibacillus composti]
MLTTGYGTGVYASEAHVLQADFTEILLPDPLRDAEQAVSYTVADQEGMRNFTITINGENHSFTYQESDTGMWFDHVVLSNHIRHRVENGQVISSMAAELGHGVAPGRVEAAYELKDGQFVLAGVWFVEGV